ncbi:PREDICTED: alpha-ketoglutarate-dependent dioxygenase alkB homolog 7, mitochondrial-like [Priapulus caudatus]|uniref:Alpha-ketoglutarate-dependent dioxygenase alkB homolog 7, mitochondrial-like n=1 Tax=Priapulus caudatus TaxID=37621 RepID=A0ABM1E560_PRICU|nr:PREDICTED: alpha-ketoglutarate-dependent dioxygenase alkB homolog 7, mitochondrial-like [Priapulus caudatus]
MSVIALRVQRVPCWHMSSDIRRKACNILPTAIRNYIVGICQTNDKRLQQLMGYSNTGINDQIERTKTSGSSGGNDNHRTVSCSGVADAANSLDGYPNISFSSHKAKKLVGDSLMVIDDFITPEEETSFLDEVLPYMKRLRYEYDHWDNAIHGYRETERSQWNDVNCATLQRLRDTALPHGVPQLTLVHVLDLAKNGYIKPHVDSVRFCGSTIAGLSLMSNSIMRFIHEEDKEIVVDALLKRRSLYIMRGVIRYHFTHELLDDKESLFRSIHVPRDRRMSIICRVNTDDNDCGTSGVH